MVKLRKTAKKTMRLSAHDSHDLLHAVDILRAHGTVALPTETVYGLAAHGLEKKAILKVFKAKNRPAKNPLILHVDNKENAERLFDFSENNSQLTKRFNLLADKFWPGPLTIIAKKAAHVPHEASGNLSTAAVRIPRNPTTLSILKNLGFPLVMPSANRSTRPSPTTADHVFATLDGLIDAVVDDGNCEVGIESTVVKIDGERPLLLRPGIVDKAMLKDCLQEDVDDNVEHDEPICPGLQFLHYSPKVSSVNMASENTIRDGWPSTEIFLLTKAEDKRLTSLYGPRPLDAITLVLSDDPKEFAQELYGALYVSERTPDKHLYIVSPTTESSLWSAVIDRLRRAVGIRQISDDQKH